MPRYRTKSRLAPVAYPSQAIQLDIETGQCRLLVSLEVRTEVKGQRINRQKNMD